MLSEIPWIFALALFLIAGGRWLVKGPKVTHSHRRGRQLRSLKEVDLILSKATAPRESTFQLGDRVYPSRLAQGHLAVVGATGSGKTLLQRLLWQSVLPHIGRGLGLRALLYDAKQDALSLLAGMQLKCPVRILNPLDLRASAWALARDITAPASALQAATILIPETKGDANPFFTNAARHLLYGTLLGLISMKPGKWTLREVILTVRHPESLKATLAVVPQNDALLQYFEHPTTFQNILSTILTYTAPYEILAASWAHSRESFSLREWLGDEGILVLGNDEGNRAALDTINRLIFRRVTELLLTQPELDPGSTHRTWLFLDEVREAGKLDGLSRLLTQGRSKGAAVVLGFQDISGLRDLYGREVADELLGQCNTKVFLRLNSPETAEWASKVIGNEEVFESRAGASSHREARSPLSTSRGESLSYGITQSPLVLASELLGLPETTPEKGLSGFVVTPLTGPYPLRLYGDWLAKNLRPPRKDCPNLVPRPEAHQYLQPLDSDHNVASGGEPPQRASLPMSVPARGPIAQTEGAQPAWEAKNRTTPHALNCVLKKRG